MARRRLTDGSGASTTLAVSGAELEPILAHLAWLAEVEASWGRAKLPLGWAFRVYNGAVLLHFRWRQSFSLLEGLSAPPVLKFSKAILALVKASSASVDELRTAKGIKRADSLHISRDHRGSVAEKLVKLLRLAAKYSPKPSRVIQPVRNRDFEKTLAPEILLGEGGAEGGGNIADERLADYARVLGAVIAMNGPKSVVLSPDHREIARDKAVACLGVAAEQLGKGHRREQRAARMLVRSLRADRETSRRA